MVQGVGPEARRVVLDIAAKIFNHSKRIILKVTRATWYGIDLPVHRERSNNPLLLCFS